MLGSMLEGTVDGTVVGGASLIPGKIGNALITDGSTQYVTYGLQSAHCFANPERCSAGFTYSFWVQLLDVSAGFSSCIIDSGAFRGFPGIYVVHFTNEKKMTIGVQTYSTSYQYDGKRGSWEPGNWLHVVFTWSLVDGIQLYINGCEDDGNPSSWVQSASDFGSYKIGASSDNSNKAHMKLDHLLFWDESLNVDGIWQLYVQGGST